MSKPLDTRALQLFVAVAQCLNFRQAAQQLHISQPPLSRAIRQLEERLGLRLFDRNTQGVALTAAGAELLPKAQRILALLDQAALSLQQHLAPTKLRLGMSSALEPGLFRPLLEALGEQLPGTELEVIYQASPRLVAALKSHRLDAALIALPTDTQGFKLQPLSRQPMMVALQSRHALARRRLLSLQDLAQQPVLWFERARQPAFFDHCHEVFKRHGFAPRFVREPKDHHVLLADVAAGQGVALLPASFAALRLPGVVYRPLREGDELAVGIGLVLSPQAHPAFDLLQHLAGTMLAAA